jgi:hypothetical protein
MLAQEVTAVTVVNWRKQQRRSSDRKFEAIVAMMMAEPDPRGTVEHLLQNGPPRPMALLEIRKVI